MDSVTGVSEAFSYSSLTVFNWSEFLPHPKYKYQTLGTFHPQVQHEIQKLNTRNKYNRNYISPGPHWSQLATSGNRGPRSGPPRLPAVTKVQTSRDKNTNQCQRGNTRSCGTKIHSKPRNKYKAYAEQKYKRVSRIKYKLMPR